MKKKKVMGRRVTKKSKSSKSTKYTELLVFLVGYMEVAKEVKKLLASQSRLSDQLDLKLTSEIKFCYYILNSVCNLAPETLNKIVKIVRGPKDFEFQVISVANILAPPMESKSLLVYPEKADRRN